MSWCQERMPRPRFLRVPNRPPQELEWGLRDEWQKAMFCETQRFMKSLNFRTLRSGDTSDWLVTTARSSITINFRTTFVNLNRGNQVEKTVIFSRNVRDKDSFRLWQDTWQRFEERTFKAFVIKTRRATNEKNVVHRPRAVAVQVDMICDGTTRFAKCLCHKSTRERQTRRMPPTA